MSKSKPLSVFFACRQCNTSKKTGMAPVECFVTLEGIKKRFTLPLKKKPEDFKEQYTSSMPNELNTLCQCIVAKITKIYTTLLLDDDIITSARIVDIYLNGTTKRSFTLKELCIAFKQQKTAENIEPHTWNKYLNAYNEFLTVTKHHESDEVSSVSHADILRYEAAVRTTCAETTACKKLKNLKAFFAYGIACNKLQANPFAALKIGHGTRKEDVDFLTYKEIQQLKAARITDDRLEKVRDLFLWQSFTGQNYGDMKILEEGDVQLNEHGQHYIQKARFKTGKFGKQHIYTSVLFEDAVEIYKHYGVNLPLISPQKYNDYLSELIEKVGINKHITSKSGRKTYACYLFNQQNLSPEMIQPMMGHENLRQTQEYIKVVADTVFKAVKDSTTDKGGRHDRKGTTVDELLKTIRDANKEDYIIKKSAINGRKWYLK